MCLNPQVFRLNKNYFHFKLLLKKQKLIVSIFIFVKCSQKEFEQKSKKKNLWVSYFKSLKKLIFNLIKNIYLASSGISNDNGPKSNEVLSLKGIHTFTLPNPVYNYDSNTFVCYWSKKGTFTFQVNFTDIHQFLLKLYNPYIKVTWSLCVCLSVPHDLTNRSTDMVLL